jgi:hypothetical protein
MSPRGNWLINIVIFHDEEPVLLKK